ncbi:Uncharacterised protein at_DN0499 [Pycnogonum litorale]
MPCSFQLAWLLDDNFKEWVKQDPKNVSQAICFVCNNHKINVSTMGRQALKSHMQGKKHMQNMKILKSQAVSKTCFISYGNNSTAEISTSSPQTSTSSHPIVSSSYFNKNETLNAEIWNCVKCVECNQSFSSNSDACFFYEKMFKDSNIAKSMKCGETKSMYISCYGLAPYFRSLLEEKVKDTDGYVMLFDESLNQHLQKKQLDIHVRFWNGELIQTRYYTSAFLGHATAVDLLNVFEDNIENKFSLKNLVQLSMDGPNVN